MEKITDINLLDPGKQYTYADYLMWQLKERIELISGKIFKMSPAPDTDHQSVSGILFGNIFSQLKGKKCRIFSAPFDVRFPKSKHDPDNKIDTVVQPDICIICDLSKIDEKGCKGAPDLIIEIISKYSVRKDLHEKFELYERNSVNEYWIVHPKEKTVTVFLLNKNGKYESAKPLTIGDKLKSSFLLDIDLDLNEVFHDIVQEPEEDYEKNIQRL